MTKSTIRHKRRWKCISYRVMGKRQGWVVQIQGRTIGGLHPTELVAATTLMRELGVKSISDLPRAGGSLESQKQVVGLRSAFRGVSFHKQRQAFVVNDARTGRTYGTGKEAADARLQMSGASDATEKRKLSPRNLAARMRFVRQIYFPRQGAQLLMSDLEAAIDHIKHSARMYKAFPATEGISIQLKYRPWKDALLAAWVAEGRPEATTMFLSLENRTLQQDARVLRSVLARAVRSINEKPVSQAWSSNCSRAVGRHSSPQMVLRHLGLLEPEGPLCFGQNDDTVPHSLGSWRLTTAPEEVRGCTRKLAKFMIGWSGILAAIPQAPRTCSQWQQAQKEAYSNLRALRFSVPRLPTKGENDHVSMWTVRTYLLTIMAKEGIQRLKVDADMWTLAFCKMNPDENQHLTRMCWSFRPKSVMELLEVCGCSGLRPELFSMVACFSGDDALDDIDCSAFTAAHVQQWRRAIVAYHRQERVVCIPAVASKLV